MRILYASPCAFGGGFLAGGERYSLALARGLREVSDGDLQVELLSIGDTASSRDQGGVQLHLVPAAAPITSLFDALSWDLPNFVDRADLVHVFHPFTRFGQTVALLAHASRKALVLTHHSAITSRVTDVRAILELADCVVAYSHFAAARLPSHRTIIVPGGVDTDTFRPLPEVPDRRGFLYVGRVLPHKGVDVLLRALPPGVPLTICGTFGDNYYRAAIEPLIRAKHVEVVVAPSDAELRRRYANARALVMPSVYVDCFGGFQPEPEFMGLAALEAMACGTPAVVSGAGALSEYVEHGVTGLVAGTPSELRSALLALLHDDALVSRLGREAKQSVDQLYSHRIAARALIDVYASLLDTQVSV